MQIDDFELQIRREIEEQKREIARLEAELRKKNAIDCRSDLPVGPTNRLIISFGPNSINC